MDAMADLSLYPLSRCKIIHLVRHAQGIHNVAGEKNHSALSSYEYFDAHLSPLGWTQVETLRKTIEACGLGKRVELVISSPLLRALQTAVGVFGDEAHTDEVNVPLLMLENVGNSGHPAISSLNCPPFVAVELCRENLGVHPCDKRRSMGEYQQLFPAVDFSLLESDDDELWKPDVRESKEEVASRGLSFFKWLWTRKEKEIAIVTHNNFLFYTLNDFCSSYHPNLRSEICPRFANCELRSMVLSEDSFVKSDSATTNYPRIVPRGLGLPSNVEAEKILKKDAPQ